MKARLARTLLLVLLFPLAATAGTGRTRAGLEAAWDEGLPVAATLARLGNVLRLRRQSSSGAPVEVTTAGGQEIEIDASAPFELLGDRR